MLLTHILPLLLPLISLAEAGCTIQQYDHLPTITSHILSQHNSQDVVYC